MVNVISNVCFMIPLVSNNYGHSTQHMATTTAHVEWATGIPSRRKLSLIVFYVNKTPNLPQSYIALPLLAFSFNSNSVVAVQAVCKKKCNSRTLHIRIFVAISVLICNRQSSFYFQVNKLYQAICKMNKLKTDL